MKYFILTFAYLPLIWTVPPDSDNCSVNLQANVYRTLNESGDDSEERIIGGGHARAGQFPFSAALRIATSDSSLFCGGALISTRWVLTAAHCIANATILNITLGSISLTADDSNRLVLSSSTYFLHPEFNRTTLENDIALIEFRRNIQYSDYISKIHLPIVAYAANVNVIAIGWGQTSDDQAGFDDHLNCVGLVTISNEECKIYYGSQIIDTMICVVGQNTEGICTGDSGSPLIYLLNYRHPIIIGVASFHSGAGCESIEPSGYTRIFPYREWILNVTGGVDNRFF